MRLSLLSALHYANCFTPSPETDICLAEETLVVWSLSSLLYSHSFQLRSLYHSTFRNTMAHSLSFRVDCNANPGNWIDSFSFSPEGTTNLCLDLTFYPLVGTGDPQSNRL